jgi:hypothetical protein
MIGRFLSHAQNTDYEIAASACLKQTLRFSRIHPAEERLGVEVADDGDLILILTHRHRHFRGLSLFDTEGSQLGKYSSTSQAHPGHYHVIVRSKRKSVLQQCIPRSPWLVVSEQLERTIFKCIQGEM